MNTTRPSSSTALIAICVVALIAWLVAARAYVGCGWGWSPVALDATHVAYGVVAEAADSLFYLSFVEQARLGLHRFAILFTTDEHAPLLFNPYFIVVGQLSRWLDWPSAFTYNLSGLVGASLAVAFVIKCAEELELGLVGRAAAALLVMFGSGLSWAARIAEKLGIAGLPRGADWTFMDLFPSEAFLVYPYHACAIATLALLLWLILRAERPEAGRASPRLIPLFVIALFLAAMRPYEPLFLIAVYGVRTAAAGLSRTPDWKHCGRIWIVMTLGFAPGLGYAAWVSRQPVWEHFSTNATQLAQGRGVILMGFAILWLLALAGHRTWSRPWTGRSAVLTWWWLAAVVLLLVLNSGAVKLAGGSNLAAALLGGAALERWLRPQPGVKRAGRATMVATIVAAAVMTHPFLLRTFKATVPATDPELLAIGEALRRNAVPLPRVLCEPAVGALISGLFAARSFAGHPLLTPGYTDNVRQLEAAGFTETTANAGDTSQLDAALLKSHATHIVCRVNASVARALAGRIGAEPLLVSARWALYRVGLQPR